MANYFATVYNRNLQMDTLRHIWKTRIFLIFLTLNVPRTLRLENKVISRFLELTTEFGRACLPSRLEFSVVFSETRVNKY